MPAILDQETGNVEVTCDDCGKRITYSDKYGMFCEDSCNRAASIIAYNVVMGGLGIFAKLTGDDK